MTPVTMEKPATVTETCQDGRIGSIVGPLMGGWMMARGWSNVTIFEFASLPMLCAAAVVIAMGLRYGSNQEGFLSDEKRPALA